MRFEAIFENALDAMLLADDDRRYLAANPAACELTGYTREELLERRVDDLAPPDERGDVAELWDRFLATGKAEGEFHVQRADGRLIVADFRAVAAVAPGVHLSVLHDVTERLRAEREAAQRDERMRLLFEQLPAVLWTTDRDFRYTFASGYQRGGVPPMLADPVRTGATFADQTDTPEDLAVVIDAHQRALAGVPTSFDVRAFGIDFHCYVEPLRDGGGDTIGVIGVGFDVTETVRARRELERTVETLHTLEGQRRELIRELLVAREDERRRLARELHDDLGQMLTSVKLLVAGLERAPDDQLREGLGELHELVQEATDSTRALVGQLRRDERGEPTLRASLEQLARDTEARHGLAVEVSADVPGDLLSLPTVTAIHRIAGEAVTNAVKHANAATVSVVAMRLDHELLLVVEDDGSGFDLQATDTSTGHGLVGMRERAEELGGSLTVSSSPGAGTTIRAQLPLES